MSIDESLAGLLAGLPAELLLRVAEHLPLFHRCHLSTVNAQFRRALAPGIFYTLRASNDFDKGESLQQTVAIHGNHVRELHFELFFNAPYPDTDGDERVYTIAECHQTVWDMLGGHGLPNLEALHLTFSPQPDDFDDGDWDHDVGGGSISIWSYEEDMSRVREKEAMFAWRALFSRALEAISNRAAPLKRLKLIDLPPKKTTSQEAEQWEAMLEEVEDFEISLWAGENGAGWQSNTSEGYWSEIEALQESYFTHLTAAKKFTFVAHKYAPIGCGQGRCHVPLPLEPDDLPNVEHLHLEQCFVDQCLIDWLKKRSKQLRSLRLTDCFSAGLDFDEMDEDAEDPLCFSTDDAISWAKFFRVVRKRQPLLQHFSLCNRRSQVSAGKDTDEPLLEKVVEELNANPQRRAFEYRSLDDKYGMVFDHDAVCASEFFKGNEQEEYDLLMEMVGKNQES